MASTVLLIVALDSAITCESYRKAKSGTNIGKHIVQFYNIGLHAYCVAFKQNLGKGTSANCVGVPGARHDIIYLASSKVIGHDVYLF